MSRNDVIKIVLTGLILASSGHFRQYMVGAQNHSTSNKKSDKLVIGIIRRVPSAIFSNCSSTLQLSEDDQKHNDRYVFVDDLGKTVLMNIDGKDIRLRPVSHKEPKGEPKKGDKSVSIYTDGNAINVRIDYVLTEPCNPKEEHCEVTYYDATIAVTRSGLKRVVKAKGAIGC